MNAYGVAMSGMLAASQSFDTYAVQTVQGGANVGSAVGEIESGADFEASAQVAKVADQMMGSLLDIIV